MITERCPPPDSSECCEDYGEPVALAERVSYLLVAATIDGGSQLTAQEAGRLLQLCRDLELPERETERVLAAARTARARRDGTRP